MGPGLYGLHWQWGTLLDFFWRGGCHRFGVLYAVCVFCVCAIPIWLSLGLYCCIGGYLYIARRGFFRLGRQYSWCPISLVLVFELLGAECAVAGLAHSDCEWPWFVYLCRYQFICGCWVAFCCGDYLFWWGKLRWFVVVCYLVGGFAPVLCLVSMVSNLLVFVFFLFMLIFVGYGFYRRGGNAPRHVINFVVQIWPFITITHKWVDNLWLNLSVVILVVIRIYCLLS